MSNNKNNVQFEFGRINFDLKLNEIQSKLIDDFLVIAPKIENRVELLRFINYVIPLSANEKT